VPRSLRLEVLDLKAEVTDAGLQHLSRLTNLGAWPGETKVLGPGLAHLATSQPGV
jgi:hypothetical protein